MARLRRLGCMTTVILATMLIGSAGCADVLGAHFDEATLDEIRGGAVDSLERKCAPGERSCDGACLSHDDPRAGCGAGCGACLVPNASELACSRGTCLAVSCRPGWADCDRNPATGCEASLAEPSSCGACGVRCAAGETCGIEGCVPRPPPGCTPSTFYVDVARASIPPVACR